MHRVVLFLLTAVLLSVTAQPAAGAKRRTARASKKQSKRSAKPSLKGEKTRVRYTTRKRAYFAQGKDDGLERGDAVRGRGESGCTIERNADGYSSCATEGMRAGQTVAFTPRPRPNKTTPSRPDAPPTRQTLRAAARALASAEQTVVDFDGDSNLKRIASAGISHRVWDSFGESQVSWQRGGVYMSLRDAPLFHERIRADAELYGYQWFDRPGTTRFLPEQSTQLFVFGLSARYEGDGVFAAVGRFQPRSAPGLLVLDGAQVGVRNRFGFDEIGVYGGGYPDFVDLDRAIRRWTAGLYWRTSFGDAQGLSVSHDARLALLRTRSEELYYEAQPRLRVRVLDRVDATAVARIGLSEGSLDGARASLWIPMSDSLYLTGNYRYYSARALENDALGPRSLLPQSTQHADLAFQWQPSPWLITRAVSWYAYDRQTDRQRLMLGPELELPSALLGRGSLSWGYREEIGWLNGRTLFMQAAAEASSTLHVVGRLSYFSDSYERELSTESFDEVGLYGNLRWRFMPNFSLEFSLLSRAGLNSTLQTGLSQDRLGISTRLALTGQL